MQPQLQKGKVDHPKVVSQEEWLAARRLLLAKEKKLTCERFSRDLMSKQTGSRWSPAPYGTECSRS